MKRGLILICFILLVSGVVSANNYPVPFIVGNYSDVAIIYGTAPGTSSLELVQASNIYANLQKRSSTQLGEILVKDSEFNQVSSKNLIVVGSIGNGCSNSVFETVFEKSCSEILADSGISPGQFLVQSTTNPVSGKNVLLVIGYAVADVVNAAIYLTDGSVDTSVGTKIVGPSEGQCTDSDEGIDYYKKGRAKDYLDINPIYDYCTLDGKQVYSCTDKSLNCGIIEKYCNVNNRRDGHYIAQDEFDSTCPNGCEDGVCISEDAECYDDFDCPQIQDNYCSEFSECIKTTYYVCLNPGTVNAHCVVSGQASDCNDCPNGCSDGSCNIPSNSCTDSDGGRKYYIKGITTVPDGTMTDECEQKEGYDKNRLFEAYCCSSGLCHEVHTCINGCENGACVIDDSKYPSPFVSVNSADVAIIYGTNRGASSLELIQASNIQTDLQSKTSAQMGEILVKDSQISSASSHNLIILGIVGNVCSNAAFEKVGMSCENILKESGIESGQFLIQSIKNPFNSKKIALIIAGYSAVDVVNAATYLRNNPVATSINSKYIGGDISSPQSCTDSDGGENYYVKGTVNGLEAPEIWDTWTDYCGFAKIYDEGQEIGVTEEYGKLVEYVCKDDNYGQKVLYDCPNGCQDGVCISNLTEQCTDSDGGKNYYVKGKVVENNQYRNLEDNVFYDVCVTDTDLGNLAEAVCEIRDGALYGSQVYYECPNGCKDGACISKDPSCTPDYYCEFEPPICPSNGIQTKICEDIKCGEKGYEQDITCNPGDCSGCKLEGKCYQFGYRKNSEYCSDELSFTKQKAEEEACDNNFECRSNVCVSGECIGERIINRILNWFRRVFGRG